MSRGHIETPSHAQLAAWRAWEHHYNHVRPHQALGYRTPAEFLATLGIPMV